MFKYFLILSVFFKLNLCFAEVSLSDLGLSESEIKLSPSQMKDQAELEVRHRMLKRHEVLGLTTLGFMTATLFTGNSGSSSNTHMYLGMATGALYFTTAYFSLAAPKPAGIKDRGNIVWHKRLAWIHFPAMVLAPILGYMLKKDDDDNKFVKQHQTIAGIGYGAFALSTALMTIEF